MEDSNNAQEIIWEDEVEISDDYLQYCTKFIEVLSEIESMWEGNLDRTAVAKHEIELAHGKYVGSPLQSISSWTQVLRFWGELYRQ